MGHTATHTKTYRKLVEGTTINTTTLLSTDYLNHFNELVMLLEMVPDMPDMMMEVREWLPKTYQEHFQDSAFTHKDLAIMAYEHAPQEYRLPFDHTVKSINLKIIEGLKSIEEVLPANDPEQIRAVTLGVSGELQFLMDRASGIINGVDHQADEATEDLVHETEAEENVMNQSAIDDLFG